MLSFREWANIHEDAYGALASAIHPKTANNFKNQLRQVLPARKVLHSFKVGATTAAAGTSNHAVEAALLHDYVEHGGNLGNLAFKLNLSGRVVQMVQALSNDEKDVGSNAPLVHLQKILNDPQIDNGTRNEIILIKLSDRIDNLRKRIKAGGVGDRYLLKSKELCKYLFQQYAGDPKSALILRQRLKDLGLVIKKRHLWNIKSY